MKKLSSLFLAGLAALLPLAISLYLIWWIFIKIDRLLAPILISITGKATPGVGFLITVALIVLVGFISTSILGNKLVDFWEKIVLKTPILGKMYGTVKKIVNSFLSPDRSSFKQAVLVEFPREGAYSIGFITNDNFSHIDEENYCLFVPTTPNPTSGFFIIVPQEKVKLLDIPVEKAFELLISAGMVSDDVE